MNITNWLSHGLVDLPWYGYVLIALGLTHITILSVTLYLHRAMAHRAVDLHPAVSHFFRLWLWLTTGMITKEWAAIHRKHHAFADKEGDPHSPQIFGIKKVLREGVELYQAEAANGETMTKYGSGTPDDWLERNLYAKYNLLGIVVMLIINFSLFGFIGLSIWAVQMMWIPVFAAGVINGLGHYIGYRNFENPDRATNLLPLGFFIGGEELHNNHHTFATSAKFSVKWYEFDYGYMWLRILSAVKLAKIKKTIPVLRQSEQAKLDFQTLEALVSNRYRLAITYANSLKKDCVAELTKVKANLQNSVSWGKVKKLLAKDHELLTSAEQSTIMAMCQSSPRLHNIFTMRNELSKLWQRSSMSKEQLVNALQNWCLRAEQSDIMSLRLFARQLATIA
jgi:stearoyl-CoA desaturase (delta-9 desaturase)